MAENVPKQRHLESDPSSSAAVDLWYPTSADNLTLDNLAKILFLEKRPENSDNLGKTVEKDGFSSHDGCQNSEPKVLRFTRDNGLVGGAGNSFAGSLVGITVTISSLDELDGTWNGLLRWMRKEGIDGVSSSGVDGESDMANFVKLREKDREVDLRLAFKFPPRDDQQRIMLCDWFRFFAREAEIYSVYFPALSEYLGQFPASLKSDCTITNPAPLSVFQNLVAKCFFARAETTGNFDSCITLEDLRCSGFRALRLLDGASGEECGGILSRLAFFHAVSACFLVARPEFAETELRWARRNPFVHTESNAGYAASLRTCLGLTRATGCMTVAELELFGQVIELVESGKHLDFYRPIRGPELMVHGDLTLSNVMMDPAGAIKLIDFQMTMLGDLHIDLIMFLYTSLHTTSERSRHIVPLLKLYHEQFTLWTKRLRGASSYSYHDFAADFVHKCVHFGIARLGFALFVNLASREDFEKVGEGGNIMRVLEELGKKVQRGELNGEKSEKLTSVMLELLRIKVEDLM